MATNKPVITARADMTLLERLTQGRRGPLELLGLGALYARPSGTRAKARPKVSG